MKNPEELKALLKKLERLSLTILNDLSMNSLDILKNNLNEREEILSELKAFEGDPTFTKISDKEILSLTNKIEELENSLRSAFEENLKKVTEKQAAVRKGSKVVKAYNKK